MTVHTLGDRRWKRRPRNGCSGCLEDFTSVRAFDRHRTGAFNVKGDRARRCMDDQEMRAAGLELDSNDRWCVTADVEALRLQLWKAA